MDPSAVLLGVIGILITIIGVGIPLFVKALKDLRKDHTTEMKELQASINNTHDQCDKINERQTVVETKVDIWLYHVGFDIPKVNKTINDHIEELKKNSKSSVGCINVKELYRTKPGG